jgi:hypothetical protein
MFIDVNIVDPVTGGDPPVDKLKGNDRKKGK